MNLGTIVLASHGPVDLDRVHAVRSIKGPPPILILDLRCGRSIEIGPNEGVDLDALRRALLPERVAP